MFYLDTYTEIFAPWEEDQDEPEMIKEWKHSYAFDHLVDAAYFLRSQGLQVPSSSGLWDGCTWLSNVDDYEDPYTGERESVSVHRFAGDGWTDREWLAVIRAIEWK